MKVAGERTFEVPQQTVWEVLNDPARLAKTIPGVESFEVSDDRHWHANCNIPLGLGSLKMRIRFEKTEERPPEYASLKAKGDGVGAIMSMQTQFQLSSAGSETLMRWEADVSIAGPVGSMGQRVLQPIVNQQVRAVLTALDAQVQDALAGGGSATHGAEEGVSPASPEAYEAEPEGPTTSTED